MAPYINIQRFQNCFGNLSHHCQERVERRFIMTNVSAGNMLLASYRLGGHAWQCNTKFQTAFKKTRLATYV